MPVTGKEKKSLPRWGAVAIEALFWIVLLLYPMRHVHLGIDLKDTGYNYANHLYMGLEHMDPMWLFSTYLANVTGHLLTLLPFGRTLIGMNVYTGLLVSAAAFLGYWFATVRLKIPKALAFAGEFLALNLCWSPTAVLYNYLTYLLFLMTAVLLYEGLVQKKAWCLVLAGALLGSNVLVRFSNLPEMALITAVWLYGFLEQREEQAQDKSGFAGALLRRLCRDTGLCLGGYLLALAGWALQIHLQYGFGLYLRSIQRLFAMTENASDYQADSMLRGIVKPFLDISYWCIRCSFFIVLAVIVCLIGARAARLCKEKGKSRLAGGVTLAAAAAALALLAGMLWWLERRGFASRLFYSYDPIMRPGALFLVVALGCVLVRLFDRGTAKEEKLVAVMVAVMVVITSIGSNNGIMPSFNFLFLIAPYVFGELYRLARTGYKKKAPAVFSLAVGLWLLAGVVMRYSVGFGMCFVFAESTGVIEPDTCITGNPVLRGVRMNGERAKWMEPLSAFVDKEQLSGREVLSFGNIPAVSFYFQMPAAFNPWCDLPSYSASQMQEDMEKLEWEIDSGQRNAPVVMLEHIYQLLYLGERQLLEQEGEDPAYLDTLQQSQKWKLMCAFLDRYGYECRYECRKIGVWEKTP